MADTSGAALDRVLARVLLRAMLRLRDAAGWRYIVLVLLVVAVAFPIDAAVHEFTFRYVVSHEVRLLSNGFTLLGSAWASTGLLAALAVIGHRTADAGLVRASLGGLAGVALGSLVSHIAKQAVCRARPGLLDGWGVEAGGTADPGESGRAAARSFFNWPCLTDSRYHSFPSGHATAAFAVAAALVRAAPGRRRLWLAVASGVGASRVLLNAHFVSDVLGGVFLGWWAGEAGQALADRLPKGLVLRTSAPAAAESGASARAPSG